MSNFGFPIRLSHDIVVPGRVGVICGRVRIRPRGVRNTNLKHLNIFKYSEVHREFSDASGRRLVADASAKSGSAKRPGTTMSHDVYTIIYLKE